MKIFQIQHGQWLRWSSALLVVGFLTSATLSAAAPDPACAEKSTRERSDDIKDAYSDYKDEMVRIADELADDEVDAWKVVGGYGTNDLSRAQSSYTSDMNEANRNLSYRLQQAWNNHNAKLASCGYIVGMPSQSYQNSYPYQYGQQQYGYPYGGYQYPWYGGGNGSYPFHGQGYCPQVVMTTLPLGCGYECTRDERGCQTCEVSCRNVDTNNRPSCICPEVYSPVCGRDARTYTNSCYAQCADVGIAYGGGCR